MKTRNFISADERLFLVKYAWTSTHDQIICTQATLAKAIKETDPGRGIEYIKEFSPVKGLFKTVSKKQILAYVDWQTEDSEFLKAHSYFN